MIRLNIDVKKIDKSFLFTGAKGTYCDITLMDNRGGTDQYGNDGFAIQDVGKEKREAGIKGPIIGNWKNVGPARSPNQNGARPPEGARSPEYGKRDNGGGSVVDDEDSIPFAPNRDSLFY